MKTTNSLRSMVRGIISGSMIILFLSLSFISCSKDNDDADRDYVGNWEILSDTTKTLLYLSNNSMKMEGYSLMKDSSYYLYSIISGDLTAKGDILHIYYYEMQIDTSFKNMRIPSGYLTTYTKEMYRDFINIDSLWHLQYRYAVNGDRLNLYYDTVSFEFNRVR